MATASIGGLSSGLDTATIINQLMQLEAIPQTKLKSQVSTEQSKVSALQKVNTALTTLASTVSSLTTDSSGTWGALKTTSTGATIAASATSTVMPMTLAVRVEALATAAQTSISGVALEPGATFTINKADGSPYLDAQGAPITVSTDADPTYGELATAINATSASTGLEAVVIHGSGGDVLQLRSSATGADSNFSLISAGQTFAATDGADGAISVNGVTVTGASNTYTGAVDGLTLTIAADAAVGDTSTVTVARDASSRSSAVKSLVDNVNSVLSMIATQSAIDTTGNGASGILAGDATVRAVTTRLTEAIWPSSGSLAAYGVSLDRNGRYAFDEAKFAAAYAADPEGVTAAFTGPDGLGARVSAAAEAASDQYSGFVTTAINGHTSTIKRLSDSVAAWDDRLELRRASLERTYAALETALNRMQSQSNWLAGQLSSLSSSS